MIFAEHYTNAAKKKETKKKKKKERAEAVPTPF